MRKTATCKGIRKYYEAGVHIFCVVEIIEKYHVLNKNYYDYKFRFRIKITNLRRRIELKRLNAKKKKSI